MDTLQAAVLLAKLPYLKQWNDQRKFNARLYHDLLGDMEEISTPCIRQDTTHTFHLYVIRARQRDELMVWLRNRGIQTLIHYPLALPNLPAYQNLHHHADEFPVASSLQDEVLSLPVHPMLPHEAIPFVCKSIREFYQK
jgi:dTDP-4-amino-4,6-dideoxygalactose transaminase